MPKFNRYRSLHTTVIGPEGRPLEIQVRTREMHETAELGIAAHWRYKRGTQSAADEEWIAWVQAADGRAARTRPTRASSCKTFRTDLFDDEVYVFTPKGEVKTLPAGATPIDFAYAVHTDVGHRTVGAKVNGRIVPLHYRLKNGDFVEILTSKVGPRPVARLDVARRVVARAQQDPPVVLARDEGGARGEGPRGARAGAEGAEPAVPQARGLGGARAGDPRVGLQEGRGLLPRARLGQARPPADRQQGAPAAEDRARSPRRRPSRCKAPSARDALGERQLRHQRPRRRRRARPAREVLHAGARRRDRRLHLARQGHHDPPRRLPEREGADAQPGALHAGRVGRRRARRASASRSPSTRGTGRGCSRTSPGRSPSTARTSSPTAASSRIRWRRTGTRPRSAT